MPKIAERRIISGPSIFSLSLCLCEWCVKVNYFLVTLETRSFFFKIDGKSLGEGSPLLTKKVPLQLVTSLRGLVADFK